MLALITASIIAGSLPPYLAFQLNPIAPLRWIDVAVNCVSFAMVLFIGFYPKGKSNTGEDFFMACREITAWIAGLSFVSANPSARRSAGSKTQQASAVDTGTPGKRPSAKNGFQLQQIARIVFHSPKNCKLWLPESSKYPSPYFFWAGDRRMFPILASTT